jgi:hypothetical protein
VKQENMAGPNGERLVTRRCREHYIAMQGDDDPNWKSVVRLIDKCILMGSSSITSFVTWVNHHYWHEGQNLGGGVGKE